jgi:hypothetical protein
MPWGFVDGQNQLKEEEGKEEGGEGKGERGEEEKKNYIHMSRTRVPKV